MREQTITEIRRKKLIAIVRGLPPRHLEWLAEALEDGGISILEITFAQSQPDTWKDTAAGIRMLSAKFPGIVPGAGTVMSLSQLELARDAGARYIISPHLDPAIVRRTRELGLVSLPGAMTPTEITAAYAAGANMVKVFPANVLGAAYLKAVGAPLGHIPLLAVGGIDETNAAAYLRAGAAGLGIGGNLVNKAWIQSGNFAGITALAKTYVQIAASTETAS